MKGKYVLLLSIAVFAITAISVWSLAKASSDYAIRITTGDILMENGNLLLNNNNITDIGSLFVYGGSIYIGDQKLSETDNKLNLDNVSIDGTLYGSSALKINQEVIIQTNSEQTLVPAQLLVKNINNGTLASSNVIVENDIGFRFGLGLASSQGVFAEGVNQASLFYIGDNVMLFSIVSNEDRGWVWKHADISQFPNITSTYQMFLSPTGNLNVTANITTSEYGFFGGISVNGTGTPEATLDVNGTARIVDWYNQDLSSDGYVEVGSIIIQWGNYTSAGDGNQSFTFPTAFPNACFIVTTTNTEPNTQYVFPVVNRSTTSFIVNRDDTIDGRYVFYWIAIGN